MKAILRKIRNWISPQKENHSIGKMVDADYRELIIQNLSSGRWDEDIASQVSEDTGIQCTPEMLRPYYDYAYGEIKVGDDVGDCVAKFKCIVSMQFRINSQYGGIFGPGPSRA